MSEQAPDLHLPMDGIQPPPFYEIGPYGSGLELYSVVSDQSLVVSQRMGRCLLAVGAGMQNEKTMQQLSEEIALAIPERKIALSGQQMVRMRQKSHGHAPDIVTHLSDVKKYTLYYDNDPRPEEKDEDFADWDNGVHVRYDLQYDYVVVSSDGQRSGARVEGPYQKAIWRHMITKPDHPLTSFDLLNLFPDRTVSQATMAASLKHVEHFIENNLVIDPELLIKHKNQRAARHSCKGRVLCADNIEFVRGPGLPLERPSVEKPSFVSEMMPIKKAAAPAGFATPEPLPSDNDDVRHPFRVVGPITSRINLYSLATGETIQTHELMGRLLLALGTGMAQEKTFAQLNREISAAAPHLGRLHDDLMYRARKRVHGLASKIVTYATHQGPNTFYYEDTPRPEEKDEDFADWDNGTHIRYDNRYNYVIVSQGGRRSGIRIEGNAQTTVLQYLVKNPGMAHTTAELAGQVDNGYDVRQQMSAIMKRLKNIFAVDLGIEPESILQRKIVDGSAHHKISSYTLLADTVEVIGDTFSPKEKLQVGLVTQEDISVIALGLMHAYRSFEPIRYHLPKLPSHDELLSLVELHEFNDTQRPAEIIARQFDESIDKVKNFLDRPDATEMLKNTLISHLNTRSFITFLERLNRTSFTMQGRQILGLDAFKKAISAAANK